MGLAGPRVGGPGQSPPRNTVQLPTEKSLKLQLPSSREIGQGWPHRANENVMCRWPSSAGDSQTDLEREETLPLRMSIKEVNLSAEKPASPEKVSHVSDIGF